MTGDAALGDAVPAPPAPSLACGQTVEVLATPIAGRAIHAVSTSRGLAVVWLDAAGHVFGTTLQAEAGSAAVVRDAVQLTQYASTKLWVAANRDQILVLTEGTRVTANLLRDDLTPITSSQLAAPGTLDGRTPIAARRGGPGFVVIATATATIYALDGAIVTEHPQPRLAGLAALSIAADRDSYAVVGEMQDMFGFGCWYAQINDTFGFVRGPGALESTQQADCDSAIASASVARSGAALAWMEHDLAASSVWFASIGDQLSARQATSGGSIGGPLVTATSSGPAITWRSPAGLHGFDSAGARVVGDMVGLATLVTWNDRALAVWTTPPGALRLGRLCP